METLRGLFDADSFMPHGHCYLWNPGLVKLHKPIDLDRLQAAIRQVES
jgi:hypothetical protein